MEEEDGRETKMQDHMGDRFDKGKDGDAPEKRNEGGGCRGWIDGHLTTWARQEPRVLCSGVKTSPTIV